MKTIEELVSLSVKDIRKMQEKDVREIMDRVRSAGNKRIQRAKKANKLDPKVAKSIESGGLLSTKGKNKEELIEEFKRAKSFFKVQSTKAKKEKQKEQKQKERERAKKKRQKEREREKKKRQKEREKERERKKREKKSSPVPKEREKKSVPVPKENISPSIDTKTFHMQIVEQYNLDKLTHAKKDELSDIYDKLKNVTDKQIDILKEKGINPPALRGYEKAKEDEKPDDRNKLLSEIQKMRRFLDHETSTSEGWKKTQEEILEDLKEYNIDVPLDKFDEFFDLYEDLKEVSPSVAMRGEKYSAMEKIAIEMDLVREGKKTFEELRREIYEEFITSVEDVDTSDFFHLTDDDEDEG